MTKFYIYKMTVNNGGAPCVQDKLLSLAICKPRTRGSSKTGDVVLGFAGKRLAKTLGNGAQDNDLVYAAEVTDKVCGERYYSRARYAKRRDCIYTWNGRRFSLRPDAMFHRENDNRSHDLGAYPDYKCAEVLVSKKFRYFGDRCPLDREHLRRTFPELTELVKNLGVGERVKHNGALHKKLEEFWKLVLKSKSSYSETPVPQRAVHESCHKQQGGCSVC
jgi:hypothetical protein